MVLHVYVDERVPHELTKAPPPILQSTAHSAAPISSVWLWMGSTSKATNAARKCGDTKEIATIRRLECLRSSKRHCTDPPLCSVVRYLLLDQYSRSRTVSKNIMADNGDYEVADEVADEVVLPPWAAAKQQPDGGLVPSVRS